MQIFLKYLGKLAGVFVYAAVGGGYPNTMKNHIRIKFFLTFSDLCGYNFSYIF